MQMPNSRLVKLLGKEGKNTNELIRQYFPKGSDLRKVNEEEITQI